MTVPAKRGPDILDKLADDIKASVVETCAKVAEIHRISTPDNEFQNGINHAVAEIATKIRELNQPRKWDAGELEGCGKDSERAFIQANL